MIISRHRHVHRFSTPRVELKFQNFGRIALEFRLVFHNGDDRERERAAAALPGFHPVAAV